MAVIIIVINILHYHTIKQPMREQSTSGKKGPLSASHSFKVLEFNQNIKKVEIQVQLK